jgi:hypothetical protein
MTTTIGKGQLLYHYPSLFHLPYILREVVTKGDVPASPGETRQAPNLTSNPNPLAQLWPGGFTDKTKVRLSVRIPEGDGRLVPWLEICRQARAPRWWIRALDPTGQAKLWFIYWGVLPPAWFEAVGVREGRDSYKLWSGESLDRLAATIDEERGRMEFFEDGSVRLLPGHPDSWLLDGPARTDPTRTIPAGMAKHAPPPPPIAL